MAAAEPGNFLREDLEYQGEIGRGSYGYVKLFRHTETQELYAVKYIERGEETINQNVRREVLNHRILHHPQIVKFREVLLTPTHLAIVMEYAGGGPLFNHVVTRPEGRLGENEARYFFQQITCGLYYLHRMGFCHRDMKLENTLLDGNPDAPKVKLCDFGYSKYIPYSVAKSKVGTPAYIAPEVVGATGPQYSGEAADVWSLGVMLHAMLVGRYPFNDPQKPRDDRRTIYRIMSYAKGELAYVPPGGTEEGGVGSLLIRMLVPEPTQRATLQEVIDHRWTKQNLPADFEPVSVTNKSMHTAHHDVQTDDEVIEVLDEAKHMGGDAFGGEGMLGDEASLLAGDNPSGEFDADWMTSPANSGRDLLLSSASMLEGEKHSSEKNSTEK